MIKFSESNPHLEYLWLRLGALLGALLRILVMRDRPALLVIKPGSLGDGLLFMGALQSLRQQYPSHRLVLVCSARAQLIYARSMAVDSLLVFDESKVGCLCLQDRVKRVVMAAMIFRYRYENVLLANTAACDEAGWASGIVGQAVADRKIVLAMTESSMSRSFESLATESNVFFVPILRELHELDKTVTLLRAAGCANVKSREDIPPDMCLTKAERAWASKILENQIGLPKKSPTKSVAHEQIVSICLGARFPQKQWGAGKFAELVCCMAEEAFLKGKRIRVLLLGGVEDQDVAVSILRNVESRKVKVDTLYPEPIQPSDSEAQSTNNQAPHVGVDNQEPRTKNQELLVEDWTGRCTLHRSVALIEKSDLCIGNDTFGLHAAIAVGTPSIVLMWGGDGDQWIPWGSPAKHRMVRADVACVGGCSGKCIHVRHECMERITVEMVMDEVEYLRAKIES